MNQRRRTFLKTSVLGTAAAAGLRPGIGPGPASAATSEALPRGLTFVTVRTNGDASVRAAEAAFKRRTPTTIAGYPNDQQVWLTAGDKLTNHIERLGELAFTLG